MKLNRKEKLLEIEKIESTLSNTEKTILNNIYSYERKKLRIVYGMLLGLWFIGGHKAYLRKYIQFSIWVITFIIFCIFESRSETLTEVISTLYLIGILSSLFTNYFEMKNVNIDIKYDALQRVLNGRKIANEYRELSKKEKSKYKKGVKMDSEKVKDLETQLREKDKQLKANEFKLKKLNNNKSTDSELVNITLNNEKEDLNGK